MLEEIVEDYSQYSENALKSSKKYGSKKFISQLIKIYEN